MTHPDLPPIQAPTLRSKLVRFLPFLGFWQGGETLRADALSGTTVGLVLVPQAMAYASLAGMPPLHGLYAASFACMAGGMFGRCPQLQTGPVAMTSLLAIAAVSPLVSPDTDILRYISMMGILALLVGVLRIIMGMAGGAAITRLISKPVLIGFSCAAGITIASTQLPKMFHYNPTLENPVANALALSVHFTDSHIPTMILGFTTLLAMILFKWLTPRLPGLLISLIGVTAVSWLIDFKGMGGDIVGKLPAGLPPLVFPTQGWEMLPQLLGGACMVVVIGLLEVMTVTSAAERMHGKKPELNGELIGQGAASLVAGVTGGFPVSGSLSRSGLSLISGARTGLSSVISGLVVILTLLFLTPLLRPLPLPALGAAIVMACTALVRPMELCTTWRDNRSGTIFGVITMLLTLATAPNMVLGMGVGITLTLVYAAYTRITSSPAL